MVEKSGEFRAVFAYAYGYISGAHLNPAVTLGLAANGNIKWGDAAVYWVAQFSSAGLAAFLLKTFVGLIDPNAFAAAASNGVLTVEHAYYAMGVEALLTFFLVNTVLHTTVGGKAGPFAGWALGLTYTIAILAGGPLTGASLNPARSFGPAIFTSALDPNKPDFQNPMLYLIFFVGPFVGAILADRKSTRYAWRAVPPIHIIVKNGNVSLIGVVATKAEKNLAGMMANGVSGVFKVVNDLRVEEAVSGSGARHQSRRRSSAMLKTCLRCRARDLPSRRPSRPVSSAIL